MTDWTMKSLDHAGEVHVFSPTGTRMPARLDSGRLDRSFHELCLGISGHGKIPPGWSFEVPFRYRNQRGTRRFFRLHRPDGGTITLEFYRGHTVPREMEESLHYRLKGEQSHAEGLRDEEAIRPPRGPAAGGQGDRGREADEAPSPLRSIWPWSSRRSADDQE